MAENLGVERLTPLDLLMPRTYIGALLVFQTTESTLSVSQRLQRGLDSLLKQVPWLPGRVFSTTQAGGMASTLEIRWNANEATPTLVNKGSIAASYETLSAKGMPPAAIPADIWPVPNMIDEALFRAGAPVFGASLFRFADNQGVGLCICMHHNVVDATGFAEVVRLWVRNIAESGLPCLNPVRDRFSRLSEALLSDLHGVSSKSADSLFASHPEYSRIPPALPTEFPSCTSRLFMIPITRVNAIKELLSSGTSTAPTTNTIVCALIWSAITRARIHRNSALANDTSQLAMAVNGRRRIGAEFSTPEDPYLANAILYSLVKLSVEDLGTHFRQGSAQSLAKVCDAIARSQSSTQINSGHIAEVCSLVDHMEDYSTIYVGWDLFSARDLTITSWADLDLYQMEFGTELGKPQFVRPPHGEADGVGLILPRKRVAVAADASNEVLEIMIMLRKDDMDFLEQDSLWKSCIS